MQKYYTSTTEFNCGIDLHGREMYICVLNREGKVMVHSNIDGNDFQVFLKRVKPYRHDLTVCCECAFNWYWLADACADANIPFVLAHALYLRLIHGGKNKNDRIDSEKIAHLLRSNMIPPAYVYPAAKRPIRDLLRRRMSYVWKRAELLGHIQRGLITHNLPEVKRGQSKTRDPWFQEVLDVYKNPYHKIVLQCDFDLIKEYDRKIYKLETELLKYTNNEKMADFKVLLSVPGIGEILGLTILYEVDDISRFPSVQDFCSYCRLVKGSVASAGKIKGLKGGKMGNPYLKWAFHEAAILAKRDQKYLHAFAEKLAKKHGKHVANAIMAHKIATAVYFMLKNRTVFDPMQFVEKHMKAA
jgi:transposase